MIQHTSKMIEVLDLIVTKNGAFESYLVLDCGDAGPYLIADFQYGKSTVERHTDLNEQVRMGARPLGYIARVTVSEHVDKFVGVPFPQFVNVPAVESYLDDVIKLMIARAEAAGRCTGIGDN